MMKWLICISFMDIVTKTTQMQRINNELSATNLSLIKKILKKFGALSCHYTGQKLEITIQTIMTLT